jgi:hypothetical protein
MNTATEAQTMDIRIMPQDVVLSAADETYIRQRLYFGLAANHRDIDAVEVAVCAVPGVESRKMRRCRVEIGLVDGTAAIGDSMEDNLYVAIDRAVDRACEEITLNVDPVWRAFSRSGTFPSESNRPFAAEYGREAA